jgi:hypothetical protein
VLRLEKNTPPYLKSLAVIAETEAYCRRRMVYEPSCSGPDRYCMVFVRIFDGMLSIIS